MSDGMRTATVSVKEILYGPDKVKGDLLLERMPGHGRPVRALAKCPWHDELTESLMIDFSKGLFRCLSCGVEGFLVSDSGDTGEEGYVTLQTEDE